MKTRTCIRPKAVRLQIRLVDFHVVGTNHWSFANPLQKVGELFVSILGLPHLFARPVRDQRVGHWTRKRISVGVNGFSRTRVIPAEFHQPSFFITQRYARTHSEAERFLLRLFIRRGREGLGQSLESRKVGRNRHWECLRIDFRFGEDIRCLLILNLNDLRLEILIFLQ